MHYAGMHEGLVIGKMTKIFRIDMYLDMPDILLLFLATA